MSIGLLISETEKCMAAPINLICLVNLLENQETIKLYKDDFIHALCLIETSCDKGLISYYGKVFRVIEFT